MYVFDGSHDDELGGAWPFVVGGVICQINFGNEHDSHLLTRTLKLLDRQLERLTVCPRGVPLSILHSLIREDMRLAFRHPPSLCA